MALAAGRRCCAARGLRSRRRPAAAPAPAVCAPPRVCVVRSSSHGSSTAAAPDGLQRRGEAQQQQQQQQHQQQQGHDHQHGHRRLAGSGVSWVAEELSTLSLHQLRTLLRERGGAVRSPALLTAAIKATRDWREAGSLYTEHSASFNHIHTAALICHLPKVLPRAAGGGLASLPPSERHELWRLLEDLAQTAEEELSRCSGREMANMAHGFASLGFYPRRLMQLLLGRCSLAGLRPQELSCLAWAAARLGHDAPDGWVEQLLGRSEELLAAGRLGPQEAAGVAWALAVLQRRCLLQRAPALRRACATVGGEWQGAFRRAVAAQLEAQGGQDVSMALWSLAVLGGGRSAAGADAADAGWTCAVLGRASALAASGGMTGQQVAVTLWSVSELQRQQQRRQQQQQQQQQGQQQGQHGPCRQAEASQSQVGRSLQGYAAACFPELQRLVAEERSQLKLVCVLLLACARLGLRPPASAMAALLAAATAQLRQYAAARQPPAQAAAQWRQQEQRQQQQQQQQQVRGKDVRLHDVATLWRALAQLAYCPGPEFAAAAAAAAARACWEQGVLAGGGGGGAAAAAAAAVSPDGAAPRPARVRELAVLLWGMGRLRHQPPQELLGVARAAALLRLDSAAASDVGLLLWGFARMRAGVSSSWLRHMLRHLLSRLDDGVGTAPAVCQAVHALPRLPGGDNICRRFRERLAPELCQLAEAAAARLGECGPRELLALAQGFAQLGYAPGGAWLEQHEQRCRQLQLAGRSSPREEVALAEAHAQLRRLGQHSGAGQATDGQGGRCKSAHHAPRQLTCA